MQLEPPGLAGVAGRSGLDRLRQGRTQFALRQSGARVISAAALRRAGWGRAAGRPAAATTPMSGVSAGRCMEPQLWRALQQWSAGRPLPALAAKAVSWLRGRRCARPRRRARGWTMGRFGRGSARTVPPLSVAGGLGEGVGGPAAAGHGCQGGRLVSGRPLLPPPPAGSMVEMRPLRRRFSQYCSALSCGRVAVVKTDQR